MARPHKPINHLPVSQKELANYLGISPTMLNLAEGKQLSRNLPAGLSGKLAALGLSHHNTKISKRPKRSFAISQPKISRELAVVSDRMELDVDYYSAKAKVLQRKLDEMVSKYTGDIQWLNTVEDRMEALAGKKEFKKDHNWFENQHLVVLERLEKTGIVTQVKLEMQVELAKARAAINRKLLMKLRNKV